MTDFWAMSKCHIWSCILATTDGKLNSNVSYRLSWRLVAVFHMQRAPEAHLLTRQPGRCLGGLRPRESRKYSYVLLFLPYPRTSRKTFSGHSWVRINRGTEGSNSLPNVCTCVRVSVCVEVFGYDLVHSSCSFVTEDFFLCSAKQSSPSFSDWWTSWLWSYWVKGVDDFSSATEYVLAISLSNA